METPERFSILFVYTTMPCPATDGGKIRVLNLIRHLSRIHRVTFLCFNVSPTDEQGAKYLREMGIEVLMVRWEQNKPTTVLRSLAQRKPLTVAKYHSPEMVENMKNLLGSRKFEIIHFEMIHAGQFLSDIPVKREVKTVLGEQNIDSDVWHRLARTEQNLLKKLIFYLQYRSFMNYESRICGRFDVCICVSKEDSNKLALSCPDKAIEVVPNGVDMDYYEPGDVEEDEARIVFTGSMDWQPNEDAVLYFCHHIFPLIKAKLPNIIFYIVGSNPTDRVLKLREMQGVIVTGFVEDVRPYMANAAVYVVPLRVGGGTRLKILEALAMKKAVISTAIGCEGLDLQPDKHLLVADDPRQFADGIVQLIEDRSLRRRLGEDGRVFVRERYDWKAVVNMLDRVYRDLIRGKLTGLPM